jgi:hypothetical protein
MTVRYEVVEHDGGFAYKVGDVFSETYPTHDDALEAARQAAERQQVAGSSELIEYQDPEGGWHAEAARGDDRPDTEIEDKVDRRRGQHRR